MSLSDGIKTRWKWDCNLGGLCLSFVSSTDEIVHKIHAQQSKIFFIENFFHHLIKFKSKNTFEIESEIYYLIPFFWLSGGLLGRLLSFDDVFVNGIAEMEEIYFRWISRLNWAHNLHDWWLGVGGSGRTLSGGQRLVTSTVAGKGIAVAPFAVFV